MINKQKFHSWDTTEKAEVKAVPMKALIGSSVCESFLSHLDLQGGNSKSFSML